MSEGGNPINSELSLGKTLLVALGEPIHDGGRAISPNRLCYRSLDVDLYVYNFGASHIR